MIDVNFLYPKNENTDPICVSKQNSKHAKQVILVVFPNGEKWHYVPVKNFQHY